MWWLGQAGLMFKTEQVIVMVDPYLSDSVEKIEPQNKRKVPVDQRFLKILPDIIVLTHNHLGHTDPDTLRHYITDDSNVTVLALANAWETVQKHFNGVRNCFVIFNRHTVWTERNIRFTAVKAEHSDDAAIGFIMEAKGKKYYITGDTLYNETIFSDLPNDIDYVFLPVNGRGNNMNMTDGKRFCERIGAAAVPLHCGLFDALCGNDFGYENKIVPVFYKEIKLNEADNMELKDIFYTENKITDQSLDIYLPDNLNEQIPIFVYFHGGGLECGDKETCPFQDFTEKMSALYQLIIVCIQITDILILYGSVLRH